MRNLRNDVVPNTLLRSDLFEQSPEAQLLIDPQNDRVMCANSAARTLLGYDPQGLAKCCASSLFEERLGGLIVFTQAVLDRGQGWTDRLRCRTSQGQEISVECHATALHESGRDLLLMALRDIAACRIRLETSRANELVRRGLSEWRRVQELFRDIEQENQLILQAAGEGIYGVNAEGITTFVNPAAAHLLGYSADELVGSNMHSLLHHTHADGSHFPVKDCPIYAAFKDGVVHQEDDDVFWRADGTALPVAYTSTPIREHGHLVGAVVVFRDISERKQAEQRLHQAMSELETLKRRLEQENAYLQEELSEELHHHEIVGRSKALHQTIHRIDLVAPTDATVLITGESGTGKELIARAIHQSSQRSERPLIRVNCAAVPRELFESEFFGHLKGAFSGAVRDRTGRFQLADGGTLFLDEVGEIPIELQSKLLRVLQEGQFEPVGSERTTQVDVRIIAATNRDLQQMAADGRFREDLYFRLNVFPITSVPLRERPEDIPLLAQHFIASASRRFGCAAPRLTSAMIQRLQDYEWPGNVRELENVMERAVIISRGGALQLDLPNRSPHQPSRQGIGKGASNEADSDQGSEFQPKAEHTQGRPPELLTEGERRRRDTKTIEQALAQCGGKVFGPGGAAELLGIKPTTLASRIKRWGINR